MGQTFERSELHLLAVAALGVMMASPLYYAFGHSFAGAYGFAFAGASLLVGTGFAWLFDRLNAGGFGLSDLTSQ